VLFAVAVLLFYIYTINKVTTMMKWQCWLQCIPDCLSLVKRLAMADCRSWVVLT